MSPPRKIESNAEIERLLGGLQEAVSGLQNGMRDMWSALKDLKNENSSQHSSNLQKVESFQRVTNEKIDALKNDLTAIVTAIAEQRGAETVWRYLRHSLTAIIAAAVSAAVSFLAIHK